MEQTRSRLLERYRDGPRAVREAVASLSLTDLDRHAGQDWTAREVIHHVAEAELIESHRLRRILAEHDPFLPPVDEEEDARRLLFAGRAIETSLRLFDALVESNAALLERLSEEQWRRSGRLSLARRYSVHEWLRDMSSHSHDHAAQVLRAAGRDVI